MLLTALSALGGGLVRMLPEALKFFDRKDERKHELAMLNHNLEVARLQGTFKVEEKVLDLDAEWMKALSVVNAEQGATARAAGKFVAGISALVRPVVTYWLVGLYSTVKVSAMLYAYKAGVPFHVIMQNAWTPGDEAILGSILGFWFVGRVWERKS